MTDAGEPSEGVIFEAVTSLEGKVLGEILEGIKPEVKQKHNSPDILDEKVDATTSFEIFSTYQFQKLWPLIVRHIGAILLAACRVCRSLACW